MIYILEKELSDKKSLYFSLLQIFGMGRSQCSIICKKMGLLKNVTLGLLTLEQLTKLVKFIENSDLLINSSLKKHNSILEKTALQLKTCKSIRKLHGLPVRGQRTHTNAQTAAKLKKKT